jgi:hypothetical protein
MRKTLLIASLAALTFAPALALADIVVAPQVDTWVLEQEVEPGIAIDGDIVIGSPLPGTVVFLDVPDHDDFGYVVVNKKRVLVEKKTRKVVKVYE